MKIFFGTDYAVKCGLQTHRSEAEVNEESEKDIQEKYQILLHNETGGEHVSETKG
jgi:hypothetical protein